MRIRTLKSFPLLAVLTWFASLPSAAVSAAELSGRAAISTEWNVHSSMGLDALLFIGALTGDKLQAEHYASETADFRGRFDTETLASIERVGGMGSQTGTLVGPLLALVFSAGPDATLADIIISARDPEARLRPTFEASPYWNAERWPGLRDTMMPEVLRILLALQEAGFEQYWHEQFEPSIAQKVATMGEFLTRYDVIPEQQRLIARPLNPEIEVVLVHFTKPYGVKIVGQRFLSHHSWSADTQLRTAAHEIFHPPFDPDDQRLLASLEELQNDPWMRSIVHDHDPAFGYNSFEGVLNEDSTSALDQIVSERLGFARDPAERWRSVDDGMHMLAAALYHLMKEDGFAERGGNYPEWLDSVVDRGLLTPAEVKRRAAIVVGDAAVKKWTPAATGRVATN
jgi:hypothetical protein